MEQGQSEKKNRVRLVEYHPMMASTAPTGALAVALAQSMLNMKVVLERQTKSTRGNRHEYRNASTMDKQIVECLRKERQILHIDEYPKMGLRYIKAFLI